MDLFGFLATYGWISPELSLPVFCTFDVFVGFPDGPVNHEMSTLSLSTVFWEKST